MKKSAEYPSIESLLAFTYDTRTEFVSHAAQKKSNDFEGAKMKYYTAKEICEILHISRRTFTTYCKDRKIKHVVVANKILVAHDDLQEFIDIEKQKMLSRSQKETA